MKKLESLTIYSAKTAEMDYALHRTVSEIEAYNSEVADPARKKYYEQIVAAFPQAIEVIANQMDNVERIYEIYKPFTTSCGRRADVAADDVEFSFIAEDYPLVYDQLYLPDEHPAWDASDEEWKAFTAERIKARVLKNLKHSSSVGATNCDCLQMHDGSYLFIEEGKCAFPIREVVADTYDGWTSYMWRELPEGLGISVDADDVKVKMGKFLVNKKGTKIFMPTSVGATHIMISYTATRYGKGVETKHNVLFDRGAYYRCRTLATSRAIIEL